MQNMRVQQLDTRTGNARKGNKRAEPGRWAEATMLQYSFPACWLRLSVGDL